MAGRLAIGVAVATCFLITGSLYAQGYAPGYAPPGAPGMVASNPYGGAGAYGPSPAPYGGMPNGPPSGPGPIGGPMMPGPMGGQMMSSPMGGPMSNGPMGGPGGPMMGGPGGPMMGGPGGCPPQGGPCGPGARGPGDGMVTHADVGQSPDDIDRSPFEDILCRAARNVNVRLDYLNWTILRPHTTLIGAQPSLAELNSLFGFQFITPPLQHDPTKPFPISETSAGFAYNTAPVNLDGNDGIRGTLRLPMTYGDAEFSGFILHRSNGDINPGYVVDPALVPVIPVSQNGAPSTNILLFSQGITASFGSLVFGAEGNIVFNPIVPKDRGLTWSPIIGFRYVGIQERFDVTGFNAGAPTSTINSSTNNNLFGPQVGMRFEFLTKWFSFGAEPKLMLGVNEASANLDSFDPTIGRAGDHKDYVRLAPLGSLNVFAKVPIQEHIRFFVTYDLLGTGFISRPNEQIVYDVNTSGDNNMHLSLHNSPFLLQGYSAGFEFNF